MLRRLSYIGKAELEDRERIIHRRATEEHKFRVGQRIAEKRKVDMALFSAAVENYMARAQDIPCSLLDIDYASVELHAYAHMDAASSKGMGMLNLRPLTAAEGDDKDLNPKRAYHEMQRQN